MPQGWRQVYRGSGMRALLADAKAGKNAPEQIVRGKLTGDFTQALGSEAQLLREQLELPVALCSVLLGNDEMALRSLQCLQVTFARKEHRLAGRFAPARDAQQLAAQAIETGAGLGRERDAVAF